MSIDKTRNSLSETISIYDTVKILALMFALSIA